MHRHAVHSSGNATWTLRPALPAAVAGHAAAVAGGSLWVVGGSRWEGGTKRIETAIHRRILAGDEWEVVGELPGGFAYGGAAADHRALYLVGGLESSGPSAAIRRLELATGQASVLARLPEPRACCGAALLGETLWLLGGTSVDGNFAEARGNWTRIDLATGEIHEQAPTGPAFVNPVVVALDGKLHVLPGSVWSAERKRLESPGGIHVYEPSKDCWEFRPIPVRLPRGMSGAACDSFRAVICGGVEFRGTTPAVANGAWIYDSTDGMCTPLPELPEPRLAAAVTACRSGVLVLGGEDRPRGRASTVWEIQLNEAEGRA